MISNQLFFKLAGCKPAEIQIIMQPTECRQNAKMQNIKNAFGLQSIIIQNGHFGSLS